jgi:hypothetical protein
MVTLAYAWPRGLPRAALALILAWCAAACAPDLDDRVSIVHEPTMAAIRSLPAETVPGASVTYTTLYVGPEGPLEASALDWALCNLRKPLAILAPVHPACLEPEGHGLTPLGTGEQVSGGIPSTACRTFGPDVPETDPDEPPGRPADPDGTGGYYQPTRLRAPHEPEDDYAVGFTRLRCGLAGAGDAQIREYNERYRSNINPRLESLSLVHGEDEQGLPPADVTDDMDLPVLIPGAPVVLRVRWPECPEALDDLAVEGCGGSEPFLYFDQISRELVERREAVRVAWLATDGEFDDDRTGRDPEDTRTFSDNGWVAPGTPGIVDLWVVLRDDRGGVGWRHYRLRVE